MRIRPVKRHGRGGETMFAFEFRDEEDLTWLSTLEDLAEDTIQHEDCKKHLFEYISTLRSRCDDKYARDDVAMSSVLFADEMADFTFELLCGFVNATSFALHTHAETLAAHNADLKELISTKAELIKMIDQLKQVTEQYTAGLAEQPEALAEDAP